MTYRDWCIHNIMEQTLDCLRCGGRWDVKANCEKVDIDTVVDHFDRWGKRHEDCESSPKGQSLKAYNKWYFNESEVIFDIDVGQLYKLIKIRIPNLAWNKFFEEYQQTNYPIFNHIEVHKLFPRYRHFMFRQMWEPEIREDLIDAIKSVGGKIVGREKADPMPKSKYKWDAPMSVHRQPERIWD